MEISHSAQFIHANQEALSKFIPFDSILLLSL